MSDDLWFTDDESISLISEVSDNVVMPPPPVKDWVGDQLAEAVEYCNNWAKEHGYALRKDKGTDYKEGRVNFYCCNQGDYDTKGTSRTTTTMRVGCPFKITVRYYKDAAQTDDYLCD